MVGGGNDFRDFRLFLQRNKKCLWKYLRNVFVLLQKWWQKWWERWYIACIKNDFLTVGILFQFFFIINISCERTGFRINFSKSNDCSIQKKSLIKYCRWIITKNKILIFFIKWHQIYKQKWLSLVMSTWIFVVAINR